MAETAPSFPEEVVPRFPKLEKYLHEAKESPEFQRISRVAILRSKSIDSVLKEIESKPLGDISFSTLVMMEKNQGSQNAGQVLPPGGNAGPNESKREAAVRELLEETHLRSVRLQEIGDMSYKLEHKKRGNIHNNVTFFVAEILPTDQAYPLNPVEDKIKDFHYFDLEQVTQLFLSGKIPADARGNHGELTLLDSLSPVIREPQLEHDDERNRQAQEIQIKIVAEMQQKECRKKLNVLKHLIEVCDKESILISPPEEAGEVGTGDTGGPKEQWLKKLDVLDKDIGAAKNKKNGLYTVNAMFKIFCEIHEQPRVVADEKPKKLEEHDDFTRAYITAVDLSNFEEQVAERGRGEINPIGDSKIEAVLRFVYILVETKAWSDEYLQTAKQNEKLRDFVSRIEKFSKRVAGKAAVSTTDRFRNMVKVNVGQLDKLESDFVDVFELGSEEEAQARLQDIDSFINDITARGIQPRLGSTYHRPLIARLNEIAGASLHDLILWAFPNESSDLREMKQVFQMKDGQEKVDSPFKKRFVFEARRKLVLLYLFKEAMEYYNKVVKKDLRGPLEKMYAPLLQGMQSCGLIKQFDKDGRLTNIEPAIQQRNSAKHVGHEETIVRELVGNSGKLWYIQSDTRTKQMEDFLRKMLVRGFDDPREINDIFGREIILVGPVIDPSSSPDDQEQEVAHAMHPVVVKLASFHDSAFDIADIAKGKMPLYQSDGPNNLIPIDSEEWKKDFVEEANGVLDIMLAIAKQPGVKIFDYKPTPKKGQGIKSSSVGGGGDIRLAKFYIRHTAPDGVVRDEEVQIFSPSTDGKTGFYYQQQKKMDDERYFFDRLLETKGLRSFIELLFPTSIYDTPIHEMYRPKPKDQAASNGQK